MASNITPNNIDGTFPVAGQDNDSQGFRNNFTNISNNFSTAATEISDLQSKAILTSALTGGTLTNNMSGNPITNVTLGQVGYTLNNQGTLSGTVTLDISTGNMQEVTTGGSVTLAFSNWPTTGKYASTVLWLNVASTSHTLTLPITTPGITVGLGQIAGANTNTGVITFPATGTYIFEFLTLDGGNNIYIRDVVRNYTTIQANLTLSGGYINPNYIRTVTTTGTTTTANVMYTNWYLDSASSATLSAQTINMPFNGVEDGRTMSISALCPITTTTFTGANIKYVSTSIFSSGNVTLKLQYSTSGNVWYKY